MKLLLMVALALALSDARNQEPGVKGRLTLKGLQHGWRMGLQELQGRLDAIHIPDVRGSVSVAVVGDINYQVTGLQVKNVDLSDSSLSFLPDGGVAVLIQDGQIDIQGDLWISTFLFSASSRLNLRVRGLSITANLGITCDDLGHGAVWDGGCNSGVAHVDLWFNGGAGWLFSMFSSAMSGPVHDAISTQICPGFEKAVTQMEQVLNSLPVSLLVDSVSSVDVNLVGPPNITSESLDLLVKGEFVGHTERWDFPYPPEKLVIPDVDSRMLLLALSQFSANSAAFVHYKAGFLKLNITDDMVPRQSPIRLNMKSLAMFAPELSSHYPDSLPVLLQVSARSPPAISCEPDALSVQASTDVEAFVTYPDRPPVSIFQIQADCITGVDLVLSQEAMGATISVKNFSLALVHSDVGPVKVEAMQRTLNFALKLALPLVNGLS
ncbi:bactericidal permeability-increasing protein-like [Gastrophryne carolinensis]